MKFSPDRPYSDPDKAARKLLEITNAVEAVQDGRIQVEKINAPFLFREPSNAGRIQVLVSIWRSSAAGWFFTRAGPM